LLAIYVWTARSSLFLTHRFSFFTVKTATEGLNKRWHGPLTVQSSNRPLKVLKQSASNPFSSGVIPGHYGPLQSARRRFLFFAKFQTLKMNFFAAVLSILPLCQRSVSLVSTQISQPCYESTKATDTFICSRSPRYRLRTSIPKRSLAMYPFSISFYEHVPLKFLMTKMLRKVTELYLPM